MKNKILLAGLCITILLSALFLCFSPALYFFPAQKAYLSFYDEETGSEHIICASKEKIEAYLAEKDPQVKEKLLQDLLSAPGTSFPPVAES